ncbi:UNVERIFIED_CONTAM: hypothetical protein H355_014887 [Colinus virginianus]|nr:hypothetical protein H355_014887 [Colinus virginianus]
MAEGPAEDWMKRVEDVIKITLHGITKQGIIDYACTPRAKWVVKHLGMVTCVGSQLWWTWRLEDAFKRLADGEKQALRAEAEVNAQQLNELIGLVRQSLDACTRKKVNTLIILDVHARDIADKLVREAVFSANNFEWESHLRFYWQQEADDLLARQCAATFPYSYEYQGLNGRLVQTPLTDRCVLTLTIALHFFLGGAPAGPAGTGKTETVKDLAKALAIRCVVQNCGEGLDYKAMGVIFSGLVQTGFWGCFDEFNRINPEVLSVVSAQISTIQSGLQQNRGSVELLGKSLPLVPTVGVFVTMNPGYAGRSELPDNLKALFRPATMVVPDMAMICEIMLISEGFIEACLLSRKMTVLYTLAKAQLSKQDFYDFALRALKAALTLAGQLRNASPDESEHVLLLQALRDINIPKLVKEDVPLFLGLLADLFPSVTPPKTSNVALKEAIENELIRRNCYHSKLSSPDATESFEQQTAKALQLHDTMKTRHATMMVGGTSGGKTLIIHTLAAAHKTALKETVKLFWICPKAQTATELYGTLDSADVKDLDISVQGNP